LWLSTDRPREPLTVTLKHVLTLVAGDELAAITLAVDLGAAVFVDDARPERV
jgi:hypothetical protein